MRRLMRFLNPAAMAGGAVLTAYGGYGAGVGHAGGAELSHWLQVAATIAAGLGLTGFGTWRNGRPAGENAVSLASAFSSLEALVPALRRHPEGLAALQDLIDVLFEACHRPAIDRDARRAVTRETRGGQARA